MPRKTKWWKRPLRHIWGNHEMCLPIDCKKSKEMADEWVKNWGNE